MDLPLHSSIPSVIKTTIFLDLLILVGKSLAPDSKAFAIGVVPFGLSVFSLLFDCWDCICSKINL